MVRKYLSHHFILVIIEKCREIVKMHLNATNIKGNNNNFISHESRSRIKGSKSIDNYRLQLSRMHSQGFNSQFMYHIYSTK